MHRLDTADGRLAMKASTPQLQTRPSTARLRTAVALALLTIVGTAFASSAQAGEISINELRGAPAAENSDSDRDGAAWTAEVIDAVNIRSAPRADAKVQTTTDSYAPYSGRRAILLVTGAAREASGQEWVRVRLPVRPNGTTGWMRREAVRLVATPLSIRVRLATRTLELWSGRTLIAVYPTGIGRSKTPTPTGRFAIEDKVETPPSERAVYGRYIVTLTAHSNVLMRFNGGDGQIGIHGSGTIGRVGRPSSNGCLILGDAPLRRIWKHVGRGTPIEISAS